jgi:hypothetical protein
MKKSLGYLIVGITLIFLVSLTGCVAPPQEQKVTPVDNNNLHQNITMVTTEPSDFTFVTEVTPFERITPVVPTVTYNSLPPTTQIPTEKSCRIYTKTQTYAYNGSAFTFNLKNAPMYINYTVIPTNYTYKKLVTSKIVGKGDSVITIDTYSPNSWLEITIRNKTTGEIYLQDGFGKDYSTYLKNTLKIYKQDDLLIEMKGNLITATVSFWVKPEINFDDPRQINSTVCTEMEQHRVSLPYVTATPTPTWNGQA